MMNKWTDCSASGDRQRLTNIYNALLKYFGHRDWWPGDTRFEICVGAILTQNTAWANVEKAIGNLKGAKALSIREMAALPVKELAELIRPSGYYNQKADRLNRFANMLASDYEASLDRFFEKDTKQLRRDLLAFNGIGEETADSIVLYAAKRPKFVVDAYTKRIFSRKGFFPEKVTYREVQSFFEMQLSKDVELYNDYHAQIVSLGHNFCKPKPLCETCPVRGL